MPGVAGTLPEQREALYADAVDLLLDQWESQKLRRRADGTYEVTEPSLAEWLQVDQQTMRHLLNRLAYRRPSATRLISWAPPTSPRIRW